MVDREKLLALAERIRKSGNKNVFASGGETEDEDIYGGQIDAAAVSATLPSISSKEGKRIAGNMAGRVASGQMSLSDVPRKYQSYVEGEVKGARPMTKYMNEEAWKVPVTALAVPGTVIGATELAASAPAWGPAAAKAIEWTGEKAMPSSFAKGVSYYAPKAAKVLSKISPQLGKAVLGETAALETAAPWLDALALSAWSAQAGNQAIKSFKAGDPVAGSANAAVAALPVAMPLGAAAYKAFPKTKRDFTDWFNFVVRGDLTPYDRLLQEKAALEKDAGLLIDKVQSTFPDGVSRADLVSVKFPIHKVTRIKTLPAGEGETAFSDIKLFSTPRKTYPIGLNTENIGIPGGQRQISFEYNVPGEHPASKAGAYDMVDADDVGTLHLIADGIKNPNYSRYNDNDAFRLVFDHGWEPIPFSDVISSEPVENLLVRGKLPELSQLSRSSAYEQQLNRGTDLLVQAPRSYKTADGLTKHFANLRQEIGYTGVIAGSSTLYEKGILSGVPHDTEIITTESRFKDLEKILDFKKTGNTDVAVSGTSPKLHSSGEADIQILEEDALGGVKGKLAWEMFRTMHPEDYAKQAGESIEMPNFGSESTGRHYTEQNIYNPKTGRVYSPEELLDEFNSGNWSLQNTINDALSIMKDVKVRGGMDNLLKHNRPMSLLTNSDPEVQGMVRKAIDTIGKSQVGSDYVNGSDYFTLDFSDIAENEKFLKELGLNKKFADNPDTMRNLFDYWYLQKSVQKRGVRGAGNKKEADKFILTGNHQRGGGDASGAGRNTVASTTESMPFSYEQVGAMQTHITDTPDKYKTLSSVYDRYKALDSNSELDKSLVKYAEEVWNKNRERAVLSEDDEKVSKKVNKLFFSNEPETVSDLESKLASLARDLEYEGLSHEKIDAVIDELSTIYDVPFFYNDNYSGNYRGILKNKSHAGNTLFFDFGKVPNPNIKPYEFGRPVEKYASGADAGEKRYLSYDEISRLMPEFYEEYNKNFDLEDRLDRFGKLSKYTLGELQSEYPDLMYKDKRRGVIDLLDAALDNRNAQREVQDAIDRYNKMPGANLRFKYNEKKAQLAAEKTRGEQEYDWDFIEKSAQAQKKLRPTKKHLDAVAEALLNEPSGSSYSGYSKKDVVSISRGTGDDFVAILKDGTRLDITKQGGKYIIYDLPFKYGGPLLRPFGGVNSFWPGGKKRSLFDPKKVADRVPGDGAFSNNGTEGVLSAIKHYLKNDDSFVENRILQATKAFDAGKISSEDLTSMKVHEDAKRIYLGQPQSYDTLEPSQYTATIGKLVNPHQVNPLLTDIQFDNMIVPLWGKWKTGKDWDIYGTRGRVKNLGKTAQLYDIPYLQNAGLSAGYDDNGQYLSLYDTWDYNTAIVGKHGDNVAKWVGGKPFDIYQRYYLDDWFDIPEEARGNPYIAPSYIEEEYANGGKIHIKPENRGKFTALKERTGHSASWFKENGTPAQKKMAVFALNARKWNHADGGPLGADYTQGYLYPAPDSIIVRKPQVDIPVVAVEEPVAPAIDLEEIKKRQYFIESKFNDKAVNKHSGAMGAYQIMPITLKDYTQRTGETGDLYDYAFNEKVRDFYMNRYLNSSWATKNNQSEYNRAAKALAAYNWGPGNLIKYLEAQKKAGIDIYNGTDWLKGLPGETRNYIKWTLDGEDIGMRTTNAGYEKAKKKRFDFGGYVGDLVEQSGGDREKILEAIKNIKASRK